MSKPRIDLLQGTLALLILKSLVQGPQHGYGIARTIEQATDDVLRVEEGSLYPALHRMRKRRWITSSWGLSENNRKAKYYRLSQLGRAQLAKETTEWKQYSRAVAKMIRSS